MKCRHDIYGMTFLLTARALYTSIQTNSMIIGNEITTISITLVNINWFWQLDSLCLPSYTHSIYHNLSLLLTLCLNTTQPDVYYVSYFLRSFVFIIKHLNTLLVYDFFISILPRIQHHHRTNRKKSYNVCVARNTTLVGLSKITRNRKKNFYNMHFSFQSKSKNWTQFRKIEKLFVDTKTDRIKLFFIIFYCF